MVVKKDADFDTDMGSEKDVDKGRKDADDQESDDADEDQEEDDAEPSLEELKTELAKTKAALRKANREAERKRLAARKATPGTRKTAADDAEARAEGEVEKYRTAALRTGASAALLAAGLKVGDDPKASARRAAKLLDLEGVELTDDGDLEGLDDAIDALRDDMPHLFKEAEEEKPARRRAPAGRIDAHAGRGNRPTGGGKDKSSAERLAEALRSGR